MVVPFTQARCCSALHPCVRRAFLGFPGMAPHRLANEEHVNFGQAASASTYPRGRSLHGLGRGGEWATCSRTLSSPGLLAVLGFLGALGFLQEICLFLCRTTRAVACLGRQGSIWQVLCPVPHLPFSEESGENNSRVC